MGLEAAIRVAGPSPCPVVDAAERTELPIESVSKSSVDGSVIEEFEVSSSEIAPEGVEKVLTGDRYSAYRFEHDWSGPCFCERIEAFGCPVVDIRSDDGELRVVFRPSDVETLRDIVDELREEFGEIHLEHLVQSGSRTESDPVVVDRGQLTDRQREVLETAYEMGYFEHPKGANAQEVAAALDISSATFRGHLSAAQSKLFESLLG
jgi:predicted DNA binding protein